MHGTLLIFCLDSVNYRIFIAAAVVTESCYRDVQHPCLSYKAGSSIHRSPNNTSRDLHSNTGIMCDLGIVGVGPSSHKETILLPFGSANRSTLVDRRKPAVIIFRDTRWPRYRQVLRLCASCSVNATAPSQCAQSMAKRRITPPKAQARNRHGDHDTVPPRLGHMILRVDRGHGGFRRLPPQAVQPSLKVVIGTTTPSNGLGNFALRDSGRL